MKREYTPGLDGYLRDRPSTVFTESEWSGYDWSMLLKAYPSLDELESAANEAGVSGRDAFLALTGHQVQESASGIQADVWRKSLTTSAWTKAISSAKERSKLATMLYSMLASMGSPNQQEQEQETKPPSPEGDKTDVQDLLDQLMSIDEAMEQGVGDGVPVAIGVPSTDAVEEATDTAQLMEVLGQWMPEHTAKERMDEALRMAGDLDVREFSRMLGHVNRLVSGISRKTEAAHGTLIGYKAQEWCDKTTPLEMLAVARGDMDAIVRFAEDQLDSKVYEAQEPEGKGPAIIARDETGSMLVDRNDQKALMFEMALADAMNKDGRDLVSVAWGDTRTREYTYGETTMRFCTGVSKDGRMTGERLVQGITAADHLTQFLDGTGTYHRPAIARALIAAEEYADSADIVYLTDGRLHDRPISEQDTPITWKRLQEFKDNDGRVIIVGIGEHVTKEYLQRIMPWADAWLHINQITTNDASLSELVELISASHEQDTGTKQQQWV